MSDNKSNKRIVKNAIFLNIRMVIVIAINLYQSRVVLDVLGVEDFGIYNVVAGIVAMLAFLNNTMSSATSRFITYEMGKNNMKKVREIFSNSLFLHMLVALTLFILAETIGVWFINNHLVIPANRMLAANFVYQFSIMTMIVKTMQVPFNASIISNERMNVYAWIEIANALIILLLVFILRYWSGDSLVFYGAMLLIISIFIFILYSSYCLHTFEECTLRVKCKKEIVLPMLSFSGFDLFANMCATFKAQGLGVVINWFFGTLINAANGIANQIQAAIYNFSSTVTSAFRPQIIKSYAVGDFRRMENLLNMSIVLSECLFWCMSVPIIIEMDYILSIWLVDVPEYTADISRITIITNSVLLINTILIIPLHSKGNIKTISIWGGLIYLLSIPAAYLALKMQIKPDPLVPYIVVGVFMVVLVTTTCCVLKIEIKQFSIRRFVKHTLIPIIVITSVSTVFTIFLGEGIKTDTTRLVVLTLGYTFISVLLYGVYLFFLMDKETRKYLINKYLTKKI